MLAGLSLSFEAGVTSKISVLKHTQWPCNKAPKGLSVRGGLEACPPRNLTLRKAFSCTLGKEFLYFLNHKVMQIK